MRTEVDRRGTLVSAKVAVTTVLLMAVSLLGGPLAAGPVAASAATYGLGVFTSQSPSGVQCPKSFSCSGFRVSCPGVDQAMSGDIAKRPANGTPRGLLIFFSGSGGGDYEVQHPNAPEFMDNLHGLNFSIVAVRWSGGWLAAGGGETVGPARLGCRPATVVKWVHDHLYSESPHATGKCGFCIVGMSGGASQVGYTLAFYGLDSIIDAALPVSGPPHAALAKGCQPNDSPYQFASNNAQQIDRSYGFLQGNGPCERHDSSWIPRWTADSVDIGGSDYVHAATRVTFLLGTNDQSPAPSHGRDYAFKLGKSGSPFVSVNEVSGMSHSPWGTTNGRNALRAAILGQAIPASDTEEGGRITPGPQPSGGGGSGGPGKADPSPTRTGRRDGRGNVTSDPSPSDAPTTPSPSSGSGLAVGPIGPIKVPWETIPAATAAMAAAGFFVTRRASARRRTKDGDQES